MKMKKVEFESEKIGYYCGKISGHTMAEVEINGETMEVIKSFEYLRSF